MNRIFVDADACPVKDEALRVAQRHGWPIVYVSNSWMRLPEGDNVERVIVQDGPDAADNWIAERASEGDIVVTQDIPLASRALKAGAKAIGNSGRPFTDSSSVWRWQCVNSHSTCGRPAKLAAGPLPSQKPTARSFCRRWRLLCRR